MGCSYTEQRFACVVKDWVVTLYPTFKEKEKIMWRWIVFGVALLVVSAPILAAYLDYRRRVKLVEHIRKNRKKIFQIKE